MKSGCESVRADEMKTATNLSHQLSRLPVD